MISTAKVKLPAVTAQKLRSAADFTDNVSDFVREDLIGFKRPIAASFAFIAPPSIALVLYTMGVVTMFKFAAVMCLFVAGALYITGRIEWPNLAVEFQTRSLAKRRAVADLRCGFGEAAFLNNTQAPRFFEYDNGVIVLADAGDLKTLFLSIQRGSEDPRWNLYINGDLDRRVWRWLRLPVSREVVKFSTEGSKIAFDEEPAMIDGLQKWETVNLMLGEPLDGALIHRPIDELVEQIERAI